MLTNYVQIDRSTASRFSPRVFIVSSAPTQFCKWLNYIEIYFIFKLCNNTHLGACTVRLGVVFSLFVGVRERTFGAVGVGVAAAAAPADDAEL